MTRGLLSRSVRTVPNDRIRGVEVEAPLLHRLFGLVRVRIDAAAGAVNGKDEELVVDGVPRAEGDRLRTAVLTHRTTDTPRADGAPETAERTSPASTIAGCSTRRWSAATWPSRWPRSARCSGWRRNCRESLRPELDGPELSDVPALVLAVVAALVLLDGGVGDRRRRRQLGFPADPARWLTDRDPRAGHPAAHGAGDRPDPRLGAVGGAGHAPGRRRAVDRPGHRPRRRRPARSAAAAGPARGRPGAGCPAGRGPGPARHPPPGRAAPADRACADRPGSR